MKSLIKKVSILLVMLPVLFSAAVAADAPQKKPSANDQGFGGKIIEIGTQPILFELNDLEGNKVALEDFIGKKAVVMVFWSLYCGPCREELPLLNSIASKYMGQNLEVLAINLDGTRLKKAIQGYIKQQKFEFTVLFEEFDGPNYKVADPYGVPGTPSIVMIDMSGKVSWSHVGRESDRSLENHIREAMGL